jgi:hypothetical protein
MAIRVGVKSEGNEHVVVVENDRVGYRQLFQSYRAKAGPFGVSPAASAEAREKALDDAKDWAVKFKAAGLKAEVVEVIQ